MRIKHAIFAGSIAALTSMTAPVLARHSDAPKADEPSAASPCSARQQAADGTWTQVGCQDWAPPNKPRANPRRRSPDEKARWSKRAYEPPARPRWDMDEKCEFFSGSKPSPAAETTFPLGRYVGLFFSPVGFPRWPFPPPHRQPASSVISALSGWTSAQRHSWPRASGMDARRLLISFCWCSCSRTLPRNFTPTSRTLPSPSC